jgi:hypothetical protein
LTALGLRSIVVCDSFCNGGRVIGSVVAIVIAIASVPPADESRRVSVYPFTGTNVPPARVTEMESLVKLAILRDRSGPFVLPETDSLQPSCGPVRTAPIACLARLARSGVVLRGSVRPLGTRLGVSLSMVDGSGRVFGPLLANVQPDVDDLRPVAATLGALDGAIRNGRSTATAPQAAVSPAPARAVVTTAPAGAIAAPSAPPIRPVAPAEAVVSRHPADDDDRPTGAWMNPTGKWMMAGGLAAAAGGAVFAFLGKKLNDDLSTKYSSHTLTAADAGSYSTLDKYSLGANVLLVAGGALFATGATIYALAPENNGVGFGATGKF